MRFLLFVGFFSKPYTVGSSGFELNAVLFLLQVCKKLQKSILLCGRQNSVPFLKYTFLISDSWDH